MEKLNLEAGSRLLMETRRLSFLSEVNFLSDSSKSYFDWCVVAFSTDKSAFIIKEHSYEEYLANPKVNANMLIEVNKDTQVVESLFHAARKRVLWSSEEAYDRHIEELRERKEINNLIEGFKEKASLGELRELRELIEKLEGEE